MREFYTLTVASCSKCQQLGQNVVDQEADHVPQRKCDQDRRPGSQKRNRGREVRQKCYASDDAVAAELNDEHCPAAHSRHRGHSVLTRLVVLAPQGRYSCRPTHHEHPDACALCVTNAP